MMTFLSPRLRMPLLVAVAGTLLAAALMIHGGPTWLLAILVEVSWLAWAIRMYVRGGQNSDDGRLAGSRPDERQREISLRSRALAGNAAIVAAFLAFAVAIAIKASWWWPAGLILAVTCFFYLYGRSIYGVAEEGPAEDADDPAPATLSH